MVWDAFLHALIPRNPIIARELYNQQRTVSFRRRFIETVGVVAVALCFSVAMLGHVVHSPGARNLMDTRPIQFLAWTFHAAAALRLLAAGVWIVAQDGYLIGSDDLRLTPLSNWRLFSGKWWAALHQMRGWLLALGIVQLGVVASAGFGFLMTVDWGGSCVLSCVISIHGLYQPLWFTPTRSLFIVISATGIAILETVCCTALGMAVTILVRSKLALICAISLRFAPVLVFSFFPVYPQAGDIPISWRYLFYTWFSFADGGTGAIVLMALPYDINGANGGFERGVLGVCAVVGMLFIYLMVSLLTAWAVMRRTRH